MDKLLAVSMTLNVILLIFVIYLIVQYKQIRNLFDKNKIVEKTRSKVLYAVIFKNEIITYCRNEDELQMMKKYLDEKYDSLEFKFESYIYSYIPQIKEDELLLKNGIKDKEIRKKFKEVEKNDSKKHTDQK